MFPAYSRRNPARTKTQQNTHFVCRPKLPPPDESPLGTEAPAIVRSRIRLYQRRQAVRGSPRDRGFCTSGPRDPSRPAHRGDHCTGGHFSLHFACRHTERCHALANCRELIELPRRHAEGIPGCPGHEVIGGRIPNRPDDRSLGCFCCRLATVFPAPLTTLPLQGLGSEL